MARESWELDVNLMGEIDEMVAIYRERGMSEQDAVMIWEIMANHKELFLDAMLAAECRIIRPDTTLDARRVTWQHTVAYVYGTAIAYLPFLGLFIIQQFIHFEDPAVPSVITFLWGLVVLFYLGVSRANVYSQLPTSPWSVFSLGNQFDGVSLGISVQTVAIGVICCALAFALGRFSSNIFPHTMFVTDAAHHVVNTAVEKVTKG